MAIAFKLVLNVQRQTLPVCSHWVTPVTASTSNVQLQNRSGLSTALSVLIHKPLRQCLDSGHKVKEQFVFYLKTRPERVVCKSSWNTN